MAVRVLCSNPNCGASFSVEPAELLQEQRCPKCGWLLDSDASRTAGQPFNQPVVVPPSDLDINLSNPFAERYKLVRVLGRGGMGAVYLAQDTQLKRQVALKVPLISADEDPDFLKRFQREACALAQFHHSNICPVYDVGNHKGQPYLVMAYIEGSPLSQYVKQGKLPFEPSKAGRLVRVVAMALQKAHEAGIIHRDLKPANIMLTDEGRPIVMDFGVARRDDPEESLRTRTGQMIGTPSYMPLEQFRGDVHSMGPGSDIYSLGVILYQLLTGRLPYQGSPAHVLEQLLSSKPPPPSSHRPGLDPELEAICLKAMARQIEDRYASMTEFATALGGYLDRVSAPSSGHRSTACIYAGPDESLETTDGPEAAVDDANRDSLSTLPEHGEAIASDSMQPHTEPLHPRTNDSRRWVYAGVLGLLSLLGITGYIVTNTFTVELTRTNPKKPEETKPLVSEVRRSPAQPAPEITKADDKPATETVMANDKPTRGPEETRPGPSDVRESPTVRPELSPPSVGTRAGEERDDNGLKMKLCWCPPGSFLMGSPPTEPERDKDERAVNVTLSRGFWIGKNEVTLNQWKRVMGTTAREARKAGLNTYVENPNHPVYNVSAGDAEEFCRRLTESERAAGRLPSGWSYQLPTEARWEYACRAGTTTATAFGDRLGSRDANFDGNYPYNGASKGPYLKGAAAVGSYPGNAWGLHDMHGNVWEWCLDGYSEHLPGGVDPVGPSHASSRVIRGGGWNYIGGFCRSANRAENVPGSRHVILGFRVARVPSD